MTPVPLSSLIPLVTNKAVISDTFATPNGGDVVEGTEAFTYSVMFTVVFTVMFTVMYS